MKYLIVLLLISFTTGVLYFFSQKESKIISVKKASINKTITNTNKEEIKKSARKSFPPPRKSRNQISRIKKQIKKIQMIRKGPKTKMNQPKRSLSNIKTDNTKQENDLKANDINYDNPAYENDGNYDANYNDEIVDNYEKSDHYKDTYDEYLDESQELEDGRVDVEYYSDEEYREDDKPENQSLTEDSY